jgi:hypothetical protein
LALLQANRLAGLHAFNAHALARGPGGSRAGRTKAYGKSGHDPKGSKHRRLLRYG